MSIVPDTFDALRAEILADPKLSDPEKALFEKQIAEARLMIACHAAGDLFGSAGPLNIVRGFPSLRVPPPLPELGPPAPAAAPPSPIAPKTPRALEGHVYLLSDRMGHYKIGKAKVVDDRLKQIGILVPYPIDLIHSFPADNYHKAEKALHRQFAANRTNGEWFALDAADVDWIKAIKEM